MRELSPILSLYGVGIFNSDCELDNNKQRAKVNNYSYTTLANFSTNYLVICKVYTDVDGIK